MSYIVVCEVSGGATGFRQSPLTDHGMTVHYKTKEEAARESSRLNREAQAQKQPAGTVPRYWVQRDS